VKEKNCYNNFFTSGIMKNNTQIKLIKNISGCARKHFRPSFSKYFPVIKLPPVQVTGYPSQNMRKRKGR
jgi:hypothetical protein